MFLVDSHLKRGCSMVWVYLAKSTRMFFDSIGVPSSRSSIQMPAAKKEHRKIFEAIKCLKAAKADQLVRDHYLQAKNRLIKRMNKSL